MSGVAEQGSKRGWLPELAASFGWSKCAKQLDDGLEDLEREGSQAKQSPS